MNKSGRLALIKSTLSAIPIHTCLVLDMPPWFVKALNKIFKAFLWSGTDVVQGGKCAVAWVRVQRPLALGGLGIFDPQRLGIALRAHWLSLQRTDPSRPWAAMTFKADAITLAFFNASVDVALGNGNSLLFWSDCMAARAGPLCHCAGPGGLVHLEMVVYRPVLVGVGLRRSLNKCRFSFG
jgi:hypothetical protein